MCYNVHYLYLKCDQSTWAQTASTFTPSTQSAQRVRVKASIIWLPHYPVSCGKHRNAKLGGLTSNNTPNPNQPTGRLFEIIHKISYDI